MVDIIRNDVDSDQRKLQQTVTTALVDDGRSRLHSTAYLAPLLSTAQVWNTVFLGRVDVFSACAFGQAHRQPAASEEAI